MSSKSKRKSQGTNKKQAQRKQMHSNNNPASELPAPSFNCEKHGDINGEVIQVNIPSKGVSDLFCLHCYHEMVKDACCIAEVKCG